MVKINLLPIREILRRRQLKSFAILAGVIFLSTIALMVFLYFVYSNKQSNLGIELSQKREQLKKLEAENKAIEEKRREIARLETQVKSIKALTETRDTPAPFMSAMSYAIPQEVWVSSVVKNGKQFSVDGVGLDNTVVVKFVQNLSRIRSDFSERNVFVREGEHDKTFFTDVKLVSIITEPSAAGRNATNAMAFKIVGHLR